MSHQKSTNVNSTEKKTILDMNLPRIDFSGNNVDLRNPKMIYPIFGKERQDGTKPTHYKEYKESKRKEYETNNN